jgi:hypothetical protein
VKDFNLIQKLVGNVTQVQIRYVDYAVTDNLGVFMPVAGHCYYAISPEHTHPAYLFTIAFDTYCRIRMGGIIYESIPSTAFMIPPGIAHQELPSETVSRYLAVIIEKDYFEKQLAMYNLTISSELSGQPMPVTERLVSAVDRWIPFTCVKSILLERTERLWLGLLNQGTRCSAQALSTVSEFPD